MKLSVSGTGIFLCSLANVSIFLCAMGTVFLFAANTVENLIAPESITILKGQYDCIAEHETVHGSKSVYVLVTNDRLQTGKQSLSISKIGESMIAYAGNADYYTFNTDACIAH